MGAIKLTKVGNSQGFTIPKEILDKADFNLGDQLEVHHINGKLIIFKKPAHHTEMKFEGAQDQSEIDWAEADLGEWDI